MKRVLTPHLRALILLTCVLGCVRSSFATTVIIPSDDDMIVGARAIVRAKVLSVGSSLDEQQNRIFTYITLRVQEVLKGQISERKIVIKEEGGQTALRGSRIYGTPEFTPNEDVLLYLDTWADGSLRVHEYFLGKFTISEDLTTRQLMAIRAPVDANVVVLNGSQSTQASGEATDRMELSAYTKMVRDKLAANLQRSQEFEQRYYSGAPVLGKPPEFESKQKHGQIEPQYAFLTSPPSPRWFEIDSGKPVTFYVNPDAAPDSQPVADVQAAMNAWSTITGSALRVSYAGATTDCSSNVNNTIIFNGCDGRWSPGGCQGTLALGGCSWYYQTKVVNGTTFTKATAGFVSINPAAACYFTSPCRIQEVLTHEMGHALGLGHTSVSTATMYAIAHFDGRCASLDASPAHDDQAAMVFIYPGQGGGPGPLTVTSASLPNGAVNSAYNQALVASGGTQPYSWSILAGSGSLPSGLTLSSAGVISGTPSATGTSSFTVKVTDAASGTAQKALSISVSAAGAGPYDAQFASQTVPTSLTPGQVFSVNMKFLNTGTQTWTGVNAYYFASQNSALNSTWGGQGVPLDNFMPVAPGQQIDVTFQATAPATAGTYNFQWQMYKNDGVTGFFGQVSTNVEVLVGISASNAAQFISQSVPASTTAGQSYSISVTMQNTGTTTWTAAGFYNLGAAFDPTPWGIANRVSLPTSVAPGAQVTFSFNITAPGAAGTYNFQWRMVQDGVEWFGQPTTNVAVNISGSLPNSAQFVSQSVPASMTAGQANNVSVTMQNTGTTTWTAANLYRLGAAFDTAPWGITNRVGLPASVAPGAQVTFSFTVFAPTTPGTYSFQWRMVQDGVEWFGQPTQNLTINVNTGSTNNAQFISQSVPASMTAGQAYSVSVTMKNTGTSTWTAAGFYSLGAAFDPAPWGIANRAALPSSVGPGAQVTFSFTVHAPATVGTYNFQWRMVQDGVEWFGQPTTNVAVIVSP